VVPKGEARWIVRQRKQTAGFVDRDAAVIADLRPGGEPGADFGPITLPRQLEVILFDELGTTDDGSLHQRNVTIFADGEVDRSPCGSGSAARLAVLDARGDLGPGQVLVHDSIVGSTFTCRVVDSLVADGYPAVIPQITGMAYRCGTSEFTLDPRDPFVAGFVLR
jgi:proline racemase